MRTLLHKLSGTSSQSGLQLNLRPTPPASPQQIYTSVQRRRYHDGYIFGPFLSAPCGPGASSAGAGPLTADPGQPRRGSASAGLFILTLSLFCLIAGMDVSLLESIGADRKMAAADGACFICYESHPPLIQCGCACRDDGGLAHVDCLEQAAGTQAAPVGTPAWWECRTCKQGPGPAGAMRTGLATRRAW